MFTTIHNESSGFIVVGHVLDEQSKIRGHVLVSFTARELHEKLAVLKRYQEDIENRTRILREKNLELMERNHQLAMGNRELQDLVVEANAVRRDREEDLRRALEGRDEVRAGSIFSTANCCAHCCVL